LAKKVKKAKAKKKPVAKKRPIPAGRNAPAQRSGSRSAAPYRAKVRMYRQGLGDCFLISLPRNDGSDRPFYVMIDCGVVLGTSDPSTVMKQVMDNIRRLAAERGVTLVVYAHGWHHSARWNDTNLVSFRRVLRFLGKRPAGMHCPSASSPTTSSRVVGIYIGWRGESIPVPGLNLTTIWSRKRIAQRIGGPATDQEERSVKFRLQARSELSNVLRELDEIRATANETALASSRPFSSLTITGHSLGGAMLLSAMQQIVFQKTIDHASPMRFSSV